MTRHDAWRRGRPSNSKRGILQTRTLWFALAALAVVAMLRRSVQTVGDGYRTSAAVLKLEAELAELQREHDELQNRLAFLATPEGKRLEAAYQLKLVRPGERLLTMRQDDETRDAMSALDSDQSRAEQPAEIVKRLARSPAPPNVPLP